MVNRREFLQATAVASAGMMTADLVHAAPSGAVLTTVQIPEADKIVITVITDNLGDATRPDYKIAQRHSFPHAYVKNALDMALHAEHGLSYHIETVVNGEEHSCLFDFATDPEGVVRNLDLLKINLRKIEALGLSHDHFDHEAAMVDILKAKKHEFANSIPLFIGEGFFAGTYLRYRSGDLTPLNLLRKEEIENLGFVKLVETKVPTAIIPGAYLSGRIELVTEYEKLNPAFVAKKGAEYVTERFPGEQAVILNAKGKGLVVLSGCAHTGIVNAVRQAQRITGIEKVYAIMGGFHLTGAKPELILKTVGDITAINPDYIVPTHCTGFEAITTFAREMPDRFILNTAGTRYTI
jgi:7,8-dihydropterin-6-yl-methyl-4-(beta-D-ribofuranosyl)aminobenzene 5'-phosphate synthase